MEDKTVNADPKHDLDSHRREAVFKELDDFYVQDGISGPVENIGELLTHFFSNTDAHETDEKGNPELLYKMYKPDYIYQMVYRATQTINFIIKLKEAWDRHPDNSINQINSSNQLHNDK